MVLRAWDAVAFQTPGTVKEDIPEVEGGTAERSVPDGCQSWAVSISGVAVSNPSLVRHQTTR